MLVSLLMEIIFFFVYLNYDVGDYQKQKDWNSSLIENNQNVSFGGSCAKTQNMQMC